MIDNPPSSIRLFALCDNMKWNHLPVPGGIYAQHPRFIEEITYIFAERNAHQQREQERREAESRAKSR